MQIALVFSFFAGLALTMFLDIGIAIAKKGNTELTKTRKVAAIFLCFVLLCVPQWIFIGMQTDQYLDPYPLSSSDVLWIYGAKGVILATLGASAVAVMQFVRIVRNR